LNNCDNYKYIFNNQTSVGLQIRAVPKIESINNICFYFDNGKLSICAKHNDYDSVKNIIALDKMELFSRMSKVSTVQKVTLIVLKPSPLGNHAFYKGISFKATLPGIILSEHL
jgi:hypothetical protein